MVYNFSCSCFSMCCSNILTAVGVLYDPNTKHLVTTSSVRQYVRASICQYPSTIKYFVPPISAFLYHVTVQYIPVLDDVTYKYISILHSATSPVTNFLILCSQSSSAVPLTTTTQGPTTTWNGIIFCHLRLEESLGSLLRLCMC